MRVIILMMLLVVCSGCAYSGPRYGVVGHETEVIAWLQAYNPTPGVKRAYFHQLELWIVGLNGEKRRAVSDPKFAMLHKNGDWGGSYYPSKDGPVGDTEPIAQTKDISCWRANEHGVATVTLDKADYYYDLWHVRFKMEPGEYILASVNAQSERDVRVRVGVDFWAQDPVTKRDTTNRGKYSEWYTGAAWKKITLP